MAQLLDTSSQDHKTEEKKDRSKMSIFGNLDVQDVNDDPFFVADGTYRSRCTEAFSSEKDGRHSFTIKYVIEDTTSEFNGKRLQDFFPMPDLTGIRSVEELSQDDKDKIARLRRRIRLAFDIPEAELNDVAPEHLVSKVVYLTVKNTEVEKDGEKKKYQNIKQAESERSVDERTGTTAQALGMGGDPDF